MVVSLYNENCLERQREIKFFQELLIQIDVYTLQDLFLGNSTLPYRLYYTHDHKNHNIHMIKTMLTFTLWVGAKLGRLRIQDKKL